MDMTNVATHTRRVQWFGNFCLSVVNMVVLCCRERWKGSEGVLVDSPHLSSDCRHAC